MIRNKVEGLKTQRGEIIYWAMNHDSLVSNVINKTLFFLFLKSKLVRSDVCAYARVTEIIILTRIFNAAIRKKNRVILTKTQVSDESPVHEAGQNLENRTASRYN